MVVTDKPRKYKQYAVPGIFSIKNIFYKQYKAAIFPQLGTRKKLAVAQFAKIKKITYQIRIYKQYGIRYVI